MPKETEPINQALTYVEQKGKSLVLPIPESRVSFPDRKEILANYRQHLKVAISQQRLRERENASQEKATIKIETNLPFVLVVGSGDWHIGNEHTDYKKWVEFHDTILNTEGAYLITVGDERDNFVLPKYSSGLFEGILNPQEQATMVLGMLATLEEKGKILARTGGNHENWTWTQAGVFLEDFWHNKLKSPLLRNGGFLHLTLNGVKYVGYLHHGKSRYNSMFNPNHASKRAFEFQGPYDFMFSGHTHVTEQAHSWRWTDEFMKDYAQLRTGTFKTSDQWARERQLGRGQPPGACILLCTKTKRMMPFLKLEDGIDSLKALNTFDQLIARGMLGLTEEKK